MPRAKTRRNRLYYLGSFCCLQISLLAFPSMLHGDWRDDVGYTKLVDILRSPIPDGAGVPISLVEAPQGTGAAYFPNTSHGFFSAASDPLGVAVNFIDGSNGQNKGESGHAFGQAMRFFGNTTSVASSANVVTVYEANHYLSQILNVSGSNLTPPDSQDFRVQNFSWVGSYADSSDGTPLPTESELNDDREALRRFDYAINADNITAMVGLANDSSVLPHLLSHSYNSIAIGRSSGSHSVGLTHLANYGVGRSKPELVAPETSTSNATSISSSVATFLHSADTVQGTNAAKSATMKAILLAGATKDSFPTWSQLDSVGDWHPLDDTYGAGELNLYNSYLVTMGGETNGSTTTPTPVARHGWDYQNLQPGSGNEMQYSFVIPAGSIAEELSIVLTWNALIQSPFHGGDPIVANLDLELVDASTGTTIDFDLNDNIVEGLSNSEVDNVEHLYLTNLLAGTYTLKVFSDDLASDFGLAWRTSTLFETASADFDEDGEVDGADFFAWQRGFGTLVNAIHASGDSDGDGDVDGDDLAFLRGELTATNSFAVGPFLAGTVLAVPEPATWVLAVAGLLLVIGLKMAAS